MSNGLPHYSGILDPLKKLGKSLTTDPRFSGGDTTGSSPPPPPKKKKKKKDDEKTAAPDPVSTLPETAEVETTFGGVPDTRAEWSGEAATPAPTVGVATPAPEEEAPHAAAAAGRGGRPYTFAEKEDPKKTTVSSLYSGPDTGYQFPMTEAQFAALPTRQRMEAEQELNRLGADPSKMILPTEADVAYYQSREGKGLKSGAPEYRLELGDLPRDYVDPMQPNAGRWIDPSSGTQFFLNEEGGRMYRRQYPQLVRPWEMDRMMNPEFAAAKADQGPDYDQAQKFREGLKGREDFEGREDFAPPEGVDRKANIAAAGAAADKEVVEDKPTGYAAAQAEHARGLPSRSELEQRNREAARGWWAGAEAEVPEGYAAAQGEHARGLLQQEADLQADLRRAGVDPDAEKLFGSKPSIEDFAAYSEEFPPRGEEEDTGEGFKPETLDDETLAKLTNMFGTIPDTAEVDAQASQEQAATYRQQQQAPAESRQIRREGGRKAERQATGGERTAIEAIEAGILENEGIASGEIPTLVTGMGVIGLERFYELVYGTPYDPEDGDSVVWMTRLEEAANDPANSGLPPNAYREKFAYTE